jgi:hypothetical protein
MVNLEELEARGLFAYQMGRLRMAAKIAVVLVPVSLVCLFESEAREACACTAVLLFVAAIGLRFRDRAGVDGVNDGLLAGSIPLAFGLLLARFAPGCEAAGFFSACTAFSILIGGGAGVIVARREAARPSRSRGWMTAATIATLAASVGCIRLGVVSVLGVALGVVLGRAASSARVWPQ